MSGMEHFRVRVCLRRWYGDERARAYQRVGAARPVRWLARRVRALLPNRPRVRLVAQGHWLPPDEPLAVLHPDDLVEVVPVSEKTQCNEENNFIISSADTDEEPKPKRKKKSRNDNDELDGESLKALCESRAAVPVESHYELVCESTCEPLAKSPHKLGCESTCAKLVKSVHEPGCELTCEQLAKLPHEPGCDSTCESGVKIPDPSLKDAQRQALALLDSCLSLEPVVGGEPRRTTRRRVRRRRPRHVDPASSALMQLDDAAGPLSPMPDDDSRPSPPPPAKTETDRAAHAVLHNETATAPRPPRLVRPLSPAPLPLYCIT